MRFYVHIVGLLVQDYFADGAVDLSGLDRRDITRSRRRSVSAGDCRRVARLCLPLRSFLRFLALEGMAAVGLDDAVLSVAGWNPSLPRAISAPDVARLLRSCDRRRTIGRRDYAILLLLGRLGLRGGEVVALELDDIDWRAGELTMRGKGRRRGAAAVAGRRWRGARRLPAPATAEPEPEAVPPRSVAPLVGFADHRCPAAQRAGASVRTSRPAASVAAPAAPHRGHRHAAGGRWRWPRSARCCATARSVTTAIYARVDVERLRTFARPWPRERVVSDSAAALDDYLRLRRGLGFQLGTPRRRAARLRRLPRGQRSRARSPSSWPSPGRPAGTDQADHRRLTAQRGARLRPLPARHRPRPRDPTARAAAVGATRRPTPFIYTPRPTSPSCWPPRSGSSRRCGPPPIETLFGLLAATGHARRRGDARSTAATSTSSRA